MLQKESWVYVSDNTNIRWLKLFHLYKGFFRKSTSDGFFVKGSARIVEPPRLEYKGFKYKFSLKGDIARAIIIRTNRKFQKIDSSSVRFYSNNLIVIKKKQDTRSKYVNGPVSKSLKRKKFISLFKTVIL